MRGKRALTWLGVLFLMLCLAIVLLDVWTSTQRALTSTEAALFQVVILILGLGGSALLGRAYEQQAAANMVKPHARSAFRRLLSLYSGLGRLQTSVQERRRSLASMTDPETSAVDLTDVDAALNLIEMQVVEQIGTADDAMEDWRDLVPDEVAKLEATARRDKPAGRKRLREL